MSRLKNNNFAETIAQQPGSSAIVRKVKETAGAIGYSGVGYQTEGVKLLALNKGKKGHTTITELIRHITW